MTKYDNNGILFLVTGPSGAGKTTLVDLLMAQKKYSTIVKKIISYTTRQPRKGERHGFDYYFIRDDEFKIKIDLNFFLEWTYVYGFYYGSSYEEVINALSKGNSLIMIVDRYGIQQIIKKIHNVFIIYITVPHQNALYERLYKRETETEFSLKVRLEKSLQEMEQEERSSIADCTIINSQLSRSARHFEKIINEQLNQKNRYNVKSVKKV